MDFVNGDGALEPILLGALGNPIRVIPWMLVEAGDDGAGIGAQFGGEGVRICFQRKNRTLRADNFEFVNGAFTEIGNEQLPDAGRTARAHGMDAAVPTIKIADHTDALRTGRPDGEMNAGDAVD